MTKYQVLLIDDDPIFRLGLKSACAQLTEWQVVADTDSVLTALTILDHQQTEPISLVILDIESDRALFICQEIKNKYPKLPILILSKKPPLNLLMLAQNLGVEGYCEKGEKSDRIFNIMAEIVNGQTVWANHWSQDRSRSILINKLSPPVQNLLINITASGYREIADNLAEVKAELARYQMMQSGNLTIRLNRLILEGKHRELSAARWLVSHLLPDSSLDRYGKLESNLALNYDVDKWPQKDRSALVKLPEASLKSELVNSQSELVTVLFTQISEKLQSDLINQTKISLEIDILRLNKKRELLEVVLHELEKVLTEMRLNNIEATTITEKKIEILQDLWANSIARFLGKYYSLNIANHNLEIVPILNQSSPQITQEILAKIPLVDDWFKHLLYQTPFLIDNTICTLGSPAAMRHAQFLMENLLIQTANAVMQPLLNNFADREEIKQQFYDQSLISTREIERFRNNLSWQYRQNKYWREPLAIFESCYWLLILDAQGFQKTTIYAPRNHELAELSGVQLAVTLGLEIRDAIVPRLREIVKFLGKGFVYILTEIIGRGIGLIGKGIMQGIGYSLQEKKHRL